MGTLRSTGQNEQKMAREKWRGGGGNDPNTRQLCSKNRTESELRNSTGDICIRMSLPALSSISLFSQILRHSRPTEAPQHSQNSRVKFHRAHTFCFHRLPSGDRPAVCCCSLNARHNLSRGFPSPLLRGRIRSVWVTRSWEYYSSFYCKKKTGLDTQHITVSK